MKAPAALVQSVFDFAIREINALEGRIVEAEDGADAMLWEQAGLKQFWDGRVWMNPPYAQPLVTQFCEKLAESVKAGTVKAAVVLVNNATDTEWFSRLAGAADAFCFPTCRCRYWHPDRETSTPLQGQVLVYTGPDRQAFCQRFDEIGLVLVRPGKQAGARPVLASTTDVAEAIPADVRTTKGGLVIGDRAQGGKA
jgi:hypothetical protein